MSLFPTDTTVQPPCAHTIYRPMGGIEGLREIRDPVGRLMVTAFPFAMARSFATTYERLAACYLLADHVTVYIGESMKTGRRLGEHAADPSKAFAREVFLIHAQEPQSLDRSALLFLQCRLTELAEEAGLVKLSNNANPQVLQWSDEDCAIFDRFVGDAQRLLFDAGCRAFNSNCASQLPTVSETEIGLSPEDDAAMEIDVPVTPPVGGELQLAYGDLWARGYWAEEGFVVLAGSEVRSVINPSANPIVTKRRGELAAAQALVAIPGLQDRLRLQVSVRFPSAAIAAKVVTGAHVSGNKWVDPSHPHRFLIAD